MSDATVICVPDQPARTALWEVRTGRRPQEDLSRVFAAAWGAHNEGFCLDWTARENGWTIVDRQLEITHPRLGILGHIDGRILELDALIENKVLNPYTTSEEFIRTFAPQCVLYATSLHMGSILLNVQQGNSAPQVFKLDHLIDGTYIDQVEHAMAEFIDCVKSDTPPHPLPAPPIPPEQWISIDLNAEHKDNWVPDMKAHLEQWRETRVMALQHEQAKKDVKALLPERIGRVTYGPITIRRARNGAVTISGAA
jgi:hypothetical protein